MSRLRLSVAVIGSVILAFPLVTLVSSFVVFPMLFYFAIGIFANFGPNAILMVHLLSQLDLPINRDAMVEAWIFCSIIWIGCAFGLSRWGDVGRTLGAKNQPYIDVPFLPWHMLIKYLTP
jgi:hypothetical protein